MRVQILHNQHIFCFEMIYVFRQLLNSVLPYQKFNNFFTRRDILIVSNVDAIFNVVFVVLLVLLVIIFLPLNVRIQKVIVIFIILFFTS